MVTQSADSDQPSAGPVLRVVRGDATPEEIAALVAVLMAAHTVEDEAAPEVARSAWSDQATRLRVTPQPGPGAWRRSALPGG